MSKDQNSEDLAFGCVALLGEPFRIPLSVLLSGYVFSCLWAWFAVPFFGAPELSTWQSAGVYALACFATPGHQATGVSVVEAATSAWVGTFIRPASYLLTGYFVKAMLP